MTAAEPSLDASLSAHSPEAATAVAGKCRRASAARALWAGFVPLLATAATLRYLIPTRLEGGDRGFAALAARLGDQHPLILAVALFFTLSAVARYWYAHLRPGIPPSAAPALADSARRAARFSVVLAAVTLLALGLRSTVVEGYRVVSPSMTPTLNVGDRVLVDRLAYGLRLPFSERLLGARLPRRGDVVVFSSDAAGADASPDTPRWLVKRVIGLPGDVVAFRNGYPVVNGWIVPSCDAGPFATTGGATTVRGRLNVELLEDRSYLMVRMPLDGTVLEDYRVPAGQVFVMGDDRGQSNDSRTWNQGTGGSVPVRSIAGRVTRLAVGAFHDGRIDWRSLLARLGTRVRESRVDLRKTDENIAACLRAPRPPSLSPPPPPAGAR